jgi:hypothetical protein
MQGAIRWHPANHDHLTHISRDPGACLVACVPSELQMSRPVSPFCVPVYRSVDLEDYQGVDDGTDLKVRDMRLLN